MAHTAGQQRSLERWEQMSKVSAVMTQCTYHCHTNGSASGVGTDNPW